MLRMARLLILLFLFLLSPTVFALNCGDFYSLYSVRFTNFISDKTTYAQGEEAHFQATVMAPKTHPVSEGKVRVQITYSNDTQASFGGHIVDEFFLPEEINLRANGSKKISFTWKIPENAMPGKYSAKVFLYMSGYQVSGISFYPDMPGSMASFYVEGEEGELLFFDRGAITVGSLHYNPLNTLTNITHPADEFLIVRVPLINDGESGDVHVTYETLVWEEVRHRHYGEFIENGEINSDSPIMAEYYAAEGAKRRESFYMGMGERKILEYRIGQLPPEAYLVRITAQKGELKAVLNLRVVVEGSEAQLAFASFEKFPIRAGEEVLVFSCYGLTTMPESAITSDILSVRYGMGEIEVLNNATYPILAKLEFSIESDKGTYYRNFSVNLSLRQGGVGFAFKYPYEIKNTTLAVRLYGSNGELLDIERTKFDYSRFEKKILLELYASPSGETINYKIRSTDELGHDAEAMVNIYLLNDSGVIYIKSEKITGVYTGSFKVSPGNYTLKAFEIREGKEISVPISIASTVVVKGEPSWAGALPPILLGVSLVIISAFLIVSILRIKKNIDREERLQKEEERRRLRMLEKWREIE
ncbi:MAG: hypothetical protein QXP42_00405 [Candidatus Micrarchaeia archaeon]